MSDESPVVWDVLIIGGGAAGFFAALACAEAVPAKRILILEKGRRPLAKVLVSGGGRCNLTHACYDPAELVRFYPRGGAALRGAFTRFQPADTVAWFERRGVRLKTELDGRIFPASDRAQTVVDCLERAAQQAGVTVWTQAPVSDLALLPPGSAARFSARLEAPPGKPYVGPVLAQQVLLASGGDAAAFSLASGLGHTIETPVPSLFTLRITDGRLAGLAGVAVAQAGVQLAGAVEGRQALAAQSGPLLVTHWGLSGPAILRLSAWGARWLHDRRYAAELCVNWLGAQPPGAVAVQAALSMLNTLKSEHGRKPVSAGPAPEGLPARLWQRLAAAAGFSAAQPWAEMSRSQMLRLGQELGDGRYQVEGKGPFKDEFVTCGGVRLAEVDFKTMQSRLVEGLYFAGEVLDIDGLTGGFNFQNAWTTGWLAGRGLRDT